MLLLRKLFFTIYIIVLIVMLSGCVEQATELDVEVTAESLWQALEENDPETAEYLLTKGVAVDAIITKQGADTPLPLIYAVQKGHSEMAALLLRHGADENASSKGQTTALHCAVENGDLYLVRMLLDAGADANLPKLGVGTPLHLALEQGNHEIAALLFPHITTVNEKLLSLACANNMYDMAQEIVVKLSLPGYKIRSLLENAINWGSADFVAVLLERLIDTGIELNETSASSLLHKVKTTGTSMLEVLEEDGISIATLSDEDAELFRDYTVWQGSEWKVMSTLESLGYPYYGFGDTCLLMAADRGYVEVAERLVDAGVDVDGHHLTMTTPLMRAVYNDHQNIVELLINGGAEVNARNQHEHFMRVILFGSARSPDDDTSESRAWLKNNPWLNGATPLLIAIKQGHTDIAYYLLNNGATANTASYYGYTPLLLALEGEYPELAERLIDDVFNEALSELLSTGQSFSREDFFNAISAGDYELVSLYLDAGMTANATRIIDDGDWDGFGTESALDKAVYAEQVDIAKLLLDRGADVNWTGDAYNRTPLISACFRGDVDMARLFLENGAEVDVQAVSEGHGYDAMVSAISSGNIEVVELLLDYGVRPDRFANSYLIHTAYMGYANIVELLVERGADVNAPGHLFAGGLGELTPLAAGAVGGNLDVIDSLLALDANVNQRISRGRETVLHYTATPDIAETLLDHGADVDARSSSGRTPLMSAIYNHNAEMVDALLKHGADVSIQDNKSRTALELAQQLGHDDIVEIIKAYKSN